MKYLCLIYDEEAKLASDVESGRRGADAGVFHLHQGHPRQRALPGRQRPAADPQRDDVRVRNGRLSTTDGPFAETKEQLGGYYLVEAKDLNEAIQIAARIPSAKSGSIEVRPIQEHQS